MLINTLTISRNTFSIINSIFYWLLSVHAHKSHVNSKTKQEIYTVLIMQVRAASVSLVSCVESSLVLILLFNKLIPANVFIVLCV